MGQLQTILDRYRNGLVERQLTLRSFANVREANNFASYDLLSLGVLLSKFTSGGVWYLQSWDKTTDSNTGQMEYMQVQVGVHTLSNRADTDADDLNDSEELNLGSDGFQIDPWKLDTDGTASRTTSTRRSARAPSLRTRAGTSFPTDRAAALRRIVRFRSAALGSRPSNPGERFPSTSRLK